MSAPVEAARAAVELFGKAPWPTYVEFTTTLLKDVMDTLVTNQINQLKAYAELVKEISQTLDEFKAKRVTDETVDRFLVENFPDPADPTRTVVVAGKEYTADDYGKFKRLLEVEDPSALPPAGLGLTAAGDKFTDTNVTNIKLKAKEVLESDAEDHYTELTTLVRLGMARIVVDRGYIHTKLYVDIRGVETRNVNSSDVRRSSLGGGVRFTGVASWLGFGGSAGGKRVHIRTVTEKDVTTVAAEAKMFGETRVEFRTETFPPPP